MGFQKGQSGNPNGRPRKGRTLTEVLEKALGQKREDGKSNCDLLAEMLIELALKDKNVYALRYIYDRCDGLPAQSIELINGAIDTRLREIMSNGE